jgi:2-oxoglutarate dehydrogenase complex dehydrogenase (E1) component-like enzyme
MNAGAYTFVRQRFNNLLKEIGKNDIGVISRPPMSATATGYAHIHKQQLAEILTAAFPVQV